MKNPKRRKRANGGQVRSGLTSHKQKGKQLIPPMMQLPNAAHVSWLNDRLPEVVWAALILGACTRSQALDVFRHFSTSCRQFVSQADGSGLNWDVTLSALAILPAEVIDCIVNALDEVGVARRTLSPLLLFEGLPGRGRWQQALPPLQEADEEEAWQALGGAVANSLDHQSQPSTDIRWMNVMFKVMLGKIRFVADAHEELVDGLRWYPDYGDMRSVRPSIRALEIAFRSGPGGEVEPASAWCQLFWDDALHRTLCLPLDFTSPQDPEPDRDVAVGDINEARRALLNHWAQTLTTSGLDARHDTTFALAFYGLACLRELLFSVNARVIAGRLLVRTLTEVRINLSFMTRSKDAGIWSRFRSYGSGQAKLALLKYEAIEGDRPNLVNGQTLEALANEDFFEEFVNIDLGSWSGSDLRKMSEHCGVKDDYDRYYGWTSAFVHGQWAAARDAVLATCLNPLHRAHRGPMPSQRPMESCVPDGLYLVNQILATVDEAYPGFAYRIAVIPSNDTLTDAAVDAQINSVNNAPESDHAQ